MYVERPPYGCYAYASKRIRRNEFKRVIMTMHAARENNNNGITNNDMYATGIISCTAGDVCRGRIIIIIKYMLYFHPLSEVYSA